MDVKTMEILAPGAAPRVAERVERMAAPDREADILIWLLFGDELGEPNEKDGRLRFADPRVGPHFKPSEIWNGMTLAKAYAVCAAVPGEIERVAIMWGVPMFTASIDAAMMLVPEGWRLDQLGEWEHPVLREKGAWYAILAHKDGQLGRSPHAHGGAIALTAAALRARA